MAGSTITLDAPDPTIRRIMQKRADGVELTNWEYKRLGQRQSAEAETMRTRGAIKSPITITPESMFDRGARRRRDEEEFSRGYSGGDPERAISGAPSPNLAPTRSTPGTPSVPPSKMPASKEAGEPSARDEDVSALARAGRGGIDVNSYVGSRYGTVSNGTAATSITPRQFFGGDARINFGRLSTPRTDIDAQGRPVKKAPPVALGTDDSMPDDEMPALAAPTAIQSPPRPRPPEEKAPRPNPVPRSLSDAPLVTKGEAQSSTPSPVRRRFLGEPQRLTSSVTPAVGAGADGNFVGGGGRYLADFETKSSAREFADYAARVSGEDASTAGRGASEPVRPAVPAAPKVPDVRSVTATPPPAADSSNYRRTTGMPGYSFKPEPGKPVPPHLQSRPDPAAPIVKRIGEVWERAKERSIFRQAPFSYLR